MEHVDAVASEFEQFSGWQMIARTALIDIAANGRDWRYRVKNVEDGRITNIAGMKNMLRTVQRL